MKRSLLHSVILAVVLAAMTSCTPVQQGAMVGGGLGATIGGLAGEIGHHHNGAEGALIGGGIGAIVGALAADYHQNYAVPRHYYRDEPYYARPAYVGRPYYRYAVPRPGLYNRYYRRPYYHY